MEFSIRRWGVGQLVASWAAYWAGLGAVTLWPFARWVYDVSGTPGAKASAGLTLGDTGFVLTAVKDGITVWTGTAPVLDVALWITLPPLAIWVLWLVLRPSSPRADALAAAMPHDALPDAARAGWSKPADSRVVSALAERRRNGQE